MSVRASGRGLHHDLGEQSRGKRGSSGTAEGAIAEIHGDDIGKDSCPYQDTSLWPPKDADASKTGICRAPAGPPAKPNFRADPITEVTTRPATEMLL
jgi:hypothetical protein